MPPRRGCIHEVPIGCGWGRQPTKTDVEKYRRRLEEMLESMERKNHSYNLDDNDEEE